jgi:hypothetical protein
MNAHPFVSESKYVESFKGVGPRAVLFADGKKKMKLAENKSEKFVINDGPCCGPVCYRSSINIPGLATCKETAFVIRDTGDKKQSKILRFALFANQTIVDRLNCVVLFPKSNANTKRFKQSHLFSVKEEVYTDTDESSDDNIEADLDLAEEDYDTQSPVVVKKHSIHPLGYLREDADNLSSNQERVSRRSQSTSPQYLEFTSPTFTPGYFKEQPESEVPTNLCAKLFEEGENNEVLPLGQWSSSSGHSCLNNSSESGLDSAQSESGDEGSSSSGDHIMAPQNAMDLEVASESDTASIFGEGDWDAFESDEPVCTKDLLFGHVSSFFFNKKRESNRG